ncbi:MAG: hypothetical protein IKS02_07985 [Fibrobacter sp.]|jgi:hypothetical protein|nr:hypothetical protein [Fibrobacter sp.]
MAEETEVKTQETKPQETKSQEKSQEKKAPASAAKKKRPAGAKRKGAPAPAAKKPSAFSDSLEERFPALAAKLKKQIEDGIKQKIKDAQNDPKVKAASKKFAAK